METIVMDSELRNWQLNTASAAERLIMGPQRDALEQVKAINDRYGLNLGITRTYRWSPGYMDQIKNYMANDYLQPHMKRKISTYFNQIDQKSWTYQDFRDKLNKLESTLFSMRARKQVFQDNGEIVERVWNAFMEKMNNELNNNEQYFNAYIGHFKFDFRSYRTDDDQIDKPALILEFKLPINLTASLTDSLTFFLYIDKSISI